MVKSNTTIKRGGARPNAGRKKSGLTLCSQKELRNIFHQAVQKDNYKGYRDIVQNLIKQAKTDPKVAAYVLDQLIGKASQMVVVEDSEPEVTMNPNQLVKQYLEEMRRESKSPA